MLIISAMTGSFTILSVITHRQHATRFPVTFYGVSDAVCCSGNGGKLNKRDQTRFN